MASNNTAERSPQVYRRDAGQSDDDKNIPPDTLAILNTRPACVYDRPKGDKTPFSLGSRCKKRVLNTAHMTEYDYTKPYITYRKFRSNRYRKNNGHMVVSGDRYVHQNLTRSYIFHRPPFDWYDASHADILDDIEEVVPIAGTLDKVHSKDIYTTPNFIANHHMMNLHNNRRCLTDESDYDEDEEYYDDGGEEYVEYVEYDNGRPHLVRAGSLGRRPVSRIASRAIHPDDDVSVSDSVPAVSKSKSFHQSKEATRRPRVVLRDDRCIDTNRSKNNNNARGVRRFYKKSEEPSESFDERQRPVTYADARVDSKKRNAGHNEEYGGEYVSYDDRHGKNTPHRSSKPAENEPYSELRHDRPVKQAWV